MLDVYNPVLQHRWRDLERFALDLGVDEQDEFMDMTGKLQNAFFAPIICPKIIS